MTLNATLNIATIQGAIFENPLVRARIIRDYGLSADARDPGEFSGQVVHALDQRPLDDPIDAEKSNAEVFRAAVRALGSNSRSWSTFVRNESSICLLLNGYDFESISTTGSSSDRLQKELKALLPGQSGGNDARSILCWIQVLRAVPGYYGKLRDLANAFQGLSRNHSNQKVENHELFLCLSGFLGYPPSSYPDELAEAVQAFGGKLKLPGMRYVLGSEFLRNLGWSGFKPDRHVMRLFGDWSIQLSWEGRHRVGFLKSMIGRDTRALTEYLEYSLMGAEITPDGVPYSVADNQVWLLGAYVETKKRYSNCNYLVSRAT